MFGFVISQMESLTFTDNNGVYEDPPICYLTGQSEIFHLFVCESR